MSRPSNGVLQTGWGRAGRAVMGGGPEKSQGVQRRPEEFAPRQLPCESRHFPARSTEERFSLRRQPAMSAPVRTRWRSRRGQAGKHRLVSIVSVVIRALTGNTEAAVAVIGGGASAAGGVQVIAWS